MKKIIIGILIIILISSIAFAAVTRSGSGSSVTYTSSMASSHSGDPKAYWAIEDTPGGGCSITGATCSGTNRDCSFVSGAIRVVGYTAEAGGGLPSSVTVTLSGSGSCTLNSGNYVESYNSGAQIVVGSSTPISTQSVSLSLGTSCCPQEADTSSPCNNDITWSELDAYITKWATGVIYCGHTITWSQLDNQITYWATH